MDVPFVCRHEVLSILLLIKFLLAHTVPILLILIYLWAQRLADVADGSFLSLPTQSLAVLSVLHLFAGTKAC